MKLSELLAPWMPVMTDCEVLGIEQDSRKVKWGDLFLAYPGTAFDGRLFIDAAFEQGAVVALYEPQDWPHLTDPRCVPFENLLQLRGEIASRFFNHPSQKIEVIGVTGTNGKTTIAYLLAQAYTRLKRPAVYLGTLGFGTPGAISSTGLTTPDPVLLQSLLAKTYSEGTQALCMEVSSHALSQGRVNGVMFKGAIFTNLTHDHLDYHHTMDAYAEAKAQLFSHTELSFVVINQDDAYAEVMKRHVAPATKIYTYGLNATSDIYASNIVLHRHGSAFTLHSPWGEYDIQIKLIGAFNVYNSLAVIASLVAAGFDMNEVTRLMPELSASPGRMEIVHEHPCVVVDYAHTPDALENALKTLRELKESSLCVVFGCGGDRDKTKRPLMGEIASRYADRVMITSDNPRTEDPLVIIEEIQAGVIQGQNPVTQEQDRKKAIFSMLKSVEKEDIVLIAGKGHEDYQQIGFNRYPFSDQAVVLEYYECIELDT